MCLLFFFFSSRRRHTRWTGDWSSDVCSSDLADDFYSGVISGTGGIHIQGTSGTQNFAATQAYTGSTIISNPGGLNLSSNGDRSEERRVGKECRCRGSPYH